MQCVPTDRLGDMMRLPRCDSPTWCGCGCMLPDEVGGLCWFSLENPGQSPRIPIYAGETKLPAGFNICGHFGYNDNAVLWHYRKANKLAQVRWGRTKDIMLNSILRYENKAFEELPALEDKAVKMLKNGEKEDAVKLLNNYTADFAGATRQTWQELEHKFWEMFWTGF